MKFEFVKDENLLLCYLLVNLKQFWFGFEYKKVIPK